MMKNTLLAGTFMMVMVLLVTAACLNTDEVSTDCEPTKLETNQNLTVYGKLTLDNMQLPLNHKLYDAVKLSVTGNSTLLGCDGSYSASTQFEKNIPLSIYDETTIRKGFYLDQPADYTFTNSKDYILVLCKLKATFADSLKYESDEMALSYRFTELKYDTAATVTYYPLVPVSGTHWYAVSN